MKNTVRLKPFAIVLALSIVGGSVHAGETPTRESRAVIGTPPPIPAWSGVHRERRRLKLGMMVLDRRGSPVGLITHVDQSKDGRPAVTILVNGTPITVRSAKLKISRDGEEAVIALTRSQIRTAAILNTL